MIKLSKLFKIAAKTDIKPVLQKIFIKNNTAYTTDAYAMAIMPVDIEGEGFLSEVNVKLAETTQRLTKSKVQPNYQLEQFDEAYPDVEAFLGGIEAYHDTHETHKVIFSRKNLINLLEAMQEDTTSFSDKITMTFTESNKPVVLKNKNGTGIIMPCRE